MAETLPGGTSVKGGELGAIQLALRVIIEEVVRPKHLHIFTDSVAALTECRNRQSPNKTVKAIRRMASQLLVDGTTIKVSWIPAHADIQGNEQAHSKARAQLDIPREPKSVQHHLQDHKYSLAPKLGVDCDEPDYDPEEAKELAKQTSRQTLRAALTPCVDPLPSGLGRGNTVLLRRIVTNTACTPARMARWSTRPTASHCNFCNDPVTPVDQYHLLWACPELEEIRRKHTPPDVTSLEEWTHPEGPPDKRRAVMTSLLDFIHKAGLTAYLSISPQNPLPRP
ncbi:hypothetical protein HPB47_001792 [Ixodes persulcatus]|uniref:Uncharacterized protein n=1 Tax=Ixodes persulcatus TaxID=34615 RepID=A0AC60PN34_IXOPE|nr:hypothetical protein HPB47_001792 [Ixodes persulcatus]